MNQPDELIGVEFNIVTYDVATRSGRYGCISEHFKVLSIDEDMCLCQILSSTDENIKSFTSKKIFKQIVINAIAQNKKPAVEAAGEISNSKNKVMQQNSNTPAVSQKLTIIQKIEQTSPTGLVGLPEVADRFKNLYSIMNGKNAEIAQVAYESEKFHFMKLLQDKPELQKCSKLSLYGCFLDMAVQGLSFDPAMKHAYVVGFPTNIGTKDQPKWETRATLMIDGRGELVIRTRQGQIKYADNPVVVWSCDSFEHGSENRMKFVNHKSVHPRPKDAEIIACYLMITRPDDTIDYAVMDIEDVMNLKAFSKQPTSLAWTKGLRGMVETKTLKHAFKSYPKVKLGNFSKLQTQVVEGPEETEFKIDYGLNGSTPLPEATGVYAPTMIVAPVNQQTKPIAQEPIPDDSFMQEALQPQSQGKVYHDDDF